MTREVIEHHLLTLENPNDKARDRLRILVEITAEDVKVVVTKHADVSVQSIEFFMEHEEFEHLQQFIFHLSPVNVEVINGGSNEI